ncbi:hypothetical protein NL676_034642 [Syzygium grande]|nr:hypothetical protein NL676_034642 [Syzygium grande]
MTHQAHRISPFIKRNPLVQIHKLGLVWPLTPDQPKELKPHRPNESKTLSLRINLLRRFSGSSAAVPPPRPQLEPLPLLLFQICFSRDFDHTSAICSFRLRSGVSDSQSATSVCIRRNSQENENSGSFEVISLYSTLLDLAAAPASLIQFYCLLKPP